MADYQDARRKGFVEPFEFGVLIYSQRIVARANRTRRSKQRLKPRPYLLKDRTPGDPSNWRLLFGAQTQLGVAQMKVAE